MADDDFETAGSGHNALGGEAARLLKDSVARIERMNETIAEFNADKAEEFKALKAKGFDVDVVKKAIQRRKKPRTDVEEKDSVLELYEGILGT